MKRIFVVLVTALMLCGCNKDERNSGSGWIKYKGTTYELHIGAVTEERDIEDREGLWLHAAAFTSNDAASNVSFAFYGETVDVEARTYNYTGVASENGAAGELIPASIQIPGYEMMLPGDLKSGEVIIKKSKDGYEFLFEFTTDENEVVSGYFNYLI